MRGRRSTILQLISCSQSLIRRNPWLELLVYLLILVNGGEVCKEGQRWSRDYHARAQVCRVSE